MPRALIRGFLFLLAAGLGALDPAPDQPVWTLSGPDGAVTPGVPFEVTAQVTLPPGFYQDAGSGFLTFEPGPPASVTGRKASPPDQRQGKPSYRGSFTLTRTLVLPPGTPAGPLGLTWTLGWQICRENGVCLLPSEKTLTGGLEVSPGAEKVPGPGSGAFWFALGAAFLGGMLLNLMPCVFPVLALKALGLAGSAGLTRAARRREALAFAAGGTGTLTLLGILTAVVGALGHRLDWGFTFQQPAFVWALTLGFWVFSLQLWGLWSWKGSPFSLSSGFRPGLGRALSGGSFLVLAAAPCTAPLLGPALGYAFSLPPAQVPLFFLAAGLGLTAPLLILSLVPAWGRFLPRPGPWMVTVERVGGFLLTATVVYLLWVLTRLTTADSVWPALILLLLTAALLALAGRWSGSRTARIAGLLLAVSLAAGSWFLVRPVPGTSPVRAAATDGGWVPFTEEAFRQTLATDRPVLVDATAAWCATCQVNELAVLDRPDVRALMDRLGLVRFRADYTRPDPAVARWLASVDRAGLPVYALYRPGKPVHLFPELLTDGNFTRALPALLGAVP